MRKVHAQLKREGHLAARCTVQRLMRAEGLSGIRRTKGPARRALVVMGLHPFGGELTRDDFIKVPVAIEVTRFHTYSVEWLPGEVRFFIDDEMVSTIQLTLNPYEFRATEEASCSEVFRVDWVRGYGRPERKVRND